MGISDFIVRKVEKTDGEKLIEFYKKAYGESTVFQSIKFLEWYFNPNTFSNEFMPDCLIGVSLEGEIVSHYGGLKYNLLLNNRIIKIVWGVNAYTYPEWRGKGINSQIVKYLVNNNAINGVIGFTQKTATFYDSLQYNVFNYSRFSRFYKIVDHKKTIEVVNYINQDSTKIKFEQGKVLNFKENVFELDANNINLYKIDFKNIVKATTLRTKDFLLWRFIYNPVVKYHCFAYASKNKISAYIACRIEQLEPFLHKAIRIVDAYGDEDHLGELLKKVQCFAIETRSIYIEFSFFGDLYNDMFINNGFHLLTNNDFALLPQTCSPVTLRENNEYVGLQSLELQDEIFMLNKSDVYFTRMDSDRDRASRVINENS